MEERSLRLDPALWERLPVELMMIILGKLPLRSLVLFRSVCPEWKDMIDSAQVVYDGPPGKPTIFYHHPGGILETEEHPSRPLLAFPNSVTSEWDKHTFPFGECDNLSFEESENVLVAADGGLLCFSRKLAADTFTIYNPITRRWRELKLPTPVFQGLPRGESTYDGVFLFILVGLTVSQETGNYKLVVAGMHKDGLRETQIYESASDVWKTSVPVPPMPITLPDGEWNTERGICCAGNMYWHVFEHDGGDHIIQALLKFDLGLESWTFVKQSIPSETPVEMHTVSHQGKVLLLEWYEREYSEDNITRDAIELVRLGSEIKLMDKRLTDLAGGTISWKPIRGIGEGDALYIVYQSNLPEDDGLRVLVYSESVWLPKWESVCDETLLCALAPTLRAYV